MKKINLSNEQIDFLQLKVNELKSKNINVKKNISSIFFKRFGVKIGASSLEKYYGK
jgi:hypothetical protein